MTCVGLLLSWSGCQHKPEPYTGQVEADLTAYTEKYLAALEDIGNLRQQLKACQESR